VTIIDAAAVTPAPEAISIRAPAGALFRVALRLWRTRIGLALVVVLVLVAAVGPVFARYGPTHFVGIAPNSPPSGKALFGTDHIGQDVWSRFLWGGREILTMAAIATALGLILGAAVGLTAAYARNVRSRSSHALAPDSTAFVAATVASSSDEKVPSRLLVAAGSGDSLSCTDTMIASVPSLPTSRSTRSAFAA